MNEILPVGSRIDHERYGEGVIAKATLTGYEVFFARGGKMEFAKSNFQVKVLSRPEVASMPQTDIKVVDLDKIIAQVLDRFAGLQHVVEIGEKWNGGTMVLQPGRTDLKGKEIPIDVFFHKIVMLRDRLRVLEQNINSNQKLSDSEKIDLQQYITRIYGSLTTFNILFDDKEDWFVGEKSK